jgi:hypothetical protein
MESMADEPASGAVHLMRKLVSRTAVKVGAAGLPGGVSAMSVTLMVTATLAERPSGSVAVTVTV